MSDAVLVALIFVAGTVMTSVIAGSQSARRQTKDWERQDTVAAAAKAASESTNRRLDQIHTLVNSNLTAAIEATLEATKAQLVMMRAVAKPDGAAVLIVEHRIEVLERTLVERAEQTAIADAQAKQ